MDHLPGRGTPGAPRKAKRHTCWELIEPGADTWREEIQIRDTTPREDYRKGVLEDVQENADTFSKDPSDRRRQKSSNSYGRHARKVTNQWPQPYTNQSDRGWKKMKTNGIIRESHSPWAAPMVLV